MEDAELLTHYCTDRAEDAFAELVRRYFPLVYSAALRRLNGDAHAAEDITQNVFTELAQQASRLASRPSLEGWLYTTTRHLALQRIRTERRRLVRERAAMMIADHDHSPQLEAERLRPFIDGVLDRLRESDREVILLRFYRGRAFADIGERLGISEDAARFRLARALERLKRLLLKSGISSSPAALTLVLAENANAASSVSVVEAVSRAALNQASLAGPGSVTPLTQFFHFMNSTKTIASVAALLVCTGGLLLYEERTELQQIHAELALRENSYRRLTRELAGARSVGLSPNAPSPAPAKSNSAGSISSSVGSPSPIATSATLSGPSSPIETKPVNWELSRNPEIRAALAAWMGSVYRSSFAAFYRSAHLSEEQIAALEALSLEQDINMGQAVLTLRPENKTLAEVAAERRKLLGDEVDQEFLRYRRTQFVHDLAIQLAGILHDTEAPLSIPQAEQLTQIFAEISSVDKTKGVPFPKDIDWSLALPRAREILTSRSTPR